jgi:WD40 repeat protein
VAFSPDGTLLASGSHDQTIRIWEIRSGRCLKILQRHHSSIKVVAFSQSENTLVSGGDDGTVKLWNTQTGEIRRNFSNSKPYEGMNITAVSGVNSSQKGALKLLGAYEGEEKLHAQSR